MRLTVNGEIRTVDAELTLAAFLASQNIPPDGVAVALNQTVVRKSDHPRTTLRDGDTVEIIHAVGGGAGEITNHFLPP
ncbi:sulfur carrier protein ThiS [bacterium]|nr:sulfur carrier protein ThiS [bacterium]